MYRALYLTLSLCLSLLATSASAEIIELVDNTKMSGSIVHYYDGVYTIETPDGAKLKLPKEKIKQIIYELPPARPEFATPEKTFERWRKALTSGDLETAVDCYSLLYQGMVTDEFSQAGTEGMKTMKAEMSKTKFTIKNTTTKGDTATLKVVRSYGDDVQTAEILFVKENGEWKMRP
jgi:hypothetical protein